MKFLLFCKTQWYYWGGGGGAEDLSEYVASQINNKKEVVSIGTGGVNAREIRWWFVEKMQ